MVVYSEFVESKNFQLFLVLDLWSLETCQDKENVKVFVFFIAYTIQINSCVHKFNMFCIEKSDESTTAIEFYHNAFWEEINKM